MRAFLAWIVTAMVSVGLGMALYTTSLAGSTTGYQEARVTPRPTETVVKTKTKIVRKPAKTKVVYVPQAAPAPVAAEQEAYVPPAASSNSSSTGTARITSVTGGSASDTSADSSKSEREHESEGDDD